MLEDFAWMVTHTDRVLLMIIFQCANGMLPGKDRLQVQTSSNSAMDSQPPHWQMISNHFNKDMAMFHPKKYVCLPSGNLR